MKTKLFKIFIISVVIFFISAIGLGVNAEGFVPNESDKANRTCGDSSNCGDYSINDMLSVLIIASNWMLGIVGSLALVAFIYGGVMFLISAGSSDKINQAKQIIIGAVIGLVVVFTSYMIIQFVMNAAGVTGQDQQWNQSPASGN